MFQQFQHTENKLHKRAMFNSFCFKRANALSVRILKLMAQLKRLKKQNNKLVSELTSAHVTIDSLELLNKKEEHLKEDIRRLLQRKRALR